MGASVCYSYHVAARYTGSCPLFNIEDLLMNPEQIRTDEQLRTDAHQENYTQTQRNTSSRLFVQVSLCKSDIINIEILPMIQ